MEPESLLPVILMCRAQQLVLLGDQCKMQPAVNSSTASSLGLARSLLERYADTAITLKEQYRMVRHKLCVCVYACLCVCVCVSVCE